MIKIDINKVTNNELAKMLNDTFSSKGIKAMYQEDLVRTIKRLTRKDTTTTPIREIKGICELLRSMGVKVTLILDNELDTTAIEGIAKGEWRTYFTGNLSYSAFMDKEIDKLREFIYIKYLNSEIDLTQRKIGEDENGSIFEYIAIGLR